ncbi:ClpP/crotonase-like domain-containing protein [Exophiala viscosa]|uniref:ClpP/crotonase-like domain-containing protein n=1 Tax=Exophiala viscosa TaxID=2486360 RepID=A0AAN6IE41_9EURO|nr:ClpP/crotonase-like domain-containing protein [Exophiala viscosa]
MSSTPPSTLRTPPPSTLNTLTLFPTPSTLLIVLNNPKGLNCISVPQHWALDALLQWYDNEPSLRCAVITGSGRAFCAGADLKEWNESNAAAKKGGAGHRTMPPSGFGAISRRAGKKPVIGAINGLAFGGGMEMVANLDLVVAAKSALFSLPEVKRGLYAMAGALPRLVRTVGKPRAMEMALTGRTVTAAEALTWGILNAVTDDAPADADILNRPVVKKALEYAEQISNNSPDSVIISRAGVVSGWEDGSAEHATQAVIDVYQKRLNEGENFHEGIKAFVEKRSPQWVGSKL